MTFTQFNGLHLDLKDLRSLMVIHVRGELGAPSHREELRWDELEVAGLSLLILQDVSEALQLITRARFKDVLAGVASEGSGHFLS